MRSQSITIISAVLTAAILASHSSAEPVVGSQIPVRVEVLSSPTAQIQRCDQLRAAINDVADENARIQRVLEVLANLDVVRRVWPKTAEAVVDAALMQADIAAEFNMPRNAVDSLQAALPLLSRTRHEPRISYRLGAAYEAAGQVAEAEKHFVAAEKSPFFKQLDRFDADDALQQMAMFYARQNQPRESMKRFRAAAELPSQTPTLKALHRLSALKEALRIKDDKDRVEAKQEARALRDAIRSAKEKNATRAANAQLLDDIESDLQAVLTRSGLQP